MTEKQFSILDMIIFPLFMAILSTIAAAYLIDREERVIAFFISSYSVIMYLVSLVGLRTKLTIRKKV
jgi:hypothetical protein